MPKRTGIKIKPSNEGKFTAWAKGKGFSGVTSAAIAAGKKSKSSVTRKRAIFAENARLS